MNIPFFNYPFLYKEHEKDIMSVISEVSSRGAFILQKDLFEFEERIAKYINAKFVLGVGNGTDSLEIILQALEYEKNKEILISAHTYIATASAIVSQGLQPVLVECGYDRMIDSEDLEKKITKDTVAIMPTQLNGRTCNMDKIQNIAKKHNLDIIEDSAQALGSKFKKKCAGTFGVAGSFSLYPAKLLGSFGDGGLIVTDNEDLYKKMYMIRDHGRDEEGEVRIWGRNSRLDNLQAAILNYKLTSYERDIIKRRAIAEQYHDSLSSIDEISLPQSPNSDPDHFDVFQNYEIVAQERDGLKSFLAENGIGTLVQWNGKAIHQHEDLDFSVSLPATDEYMKKFIMLPMNTSLTNEEVDYISKKVKEFYGK
tara:strand:+ start:3617 stop:4720 length:1104 start_codon:yes stop_codon:yes gene_type:complete